MGESELHIRVELPVREAGPVDLVSGKLSRTVGADNRITGILAASWSSADANCESGFLGSPCNEGSLTATFDVVVP